MKKSGIPPIASPSAPGNGGVSVEGGGAGAFAGFPVEVFPAVDLPLPAVPPAPVLRGGCGRGRFGMPAGDAWCALRLGSSGSALRASRSWVCGRFRGRRRRSLRGPARFRFPRPVRPPARARPPALRGPARSWSWSLGLEAVSTEAGRPSLARPRADARLWLASPFRPAPQRRPRRAASARTRRREPGNDGCGVKESSISCRAGS